MFSLVWQGTVVITGIVSIVFVVTSIPYFYYHMIKIIRRFSFCNYDLVLIRKSIKQHVANSWLFTTGLIVNLFSVFIIIAYFVGLLMTKIDVSI
jgi:hypothetical protein